MADPLLRTFLPRQVNMLPLCDSLNVRNNFSEQKRKKLLLKEKFERKILFEREAFLKFQKEKSPSKNFIAILKISYQQFQGFLLFPKRKFTPKGFFHTD